MYRPLKTRISQSRAGFSMVPSGNHTSFTPPRFTNAQITPINLLPEHLDYDLFTPRFFTISHSSLLKQIAPSLFTTGAFNPNHLSLLPFLTPGTFHSRHFSLPALFTPETFHSQHFSPLALFTPGTFHSRHFSLPALSTSGTFHSRHF